MHPTRLDRRKVISLGVASMVPPPARAGGADRSEGYFGDGVRLFLVSARDGPLIVFLQGAPDDWSLYEFQLREFGRDHLVAAPNLRGFLPSDQLEAVEAYAMPRLLGDIHALLRHFDRERCIGR
jgi:pimeloyl-ACP methyl ester carboxylesterase